MVFRRHPEELRDTRQLLEALGECRKEVLNAQHAVKPFCLTFRVLDVLKSTIDMAAWFFTGSTSHFHLMQMPDPRDTDPRS